VSVPSVEPASPRDLHRAADVDLPARVLHDILQLRAAVFVVEQNCAYLDPDGRDVEEGAVHWWIEHDGRVVACLRQLREPGGGARLGRIATAADHRGEGLAARLIVAALEQCERPVQLGAQAHLARWYRTFGFAIAGDLYIEDGIDHLPMRLDGPVASSAGPIGTVPG
jgi:ElaA protein